MRGVFLPALAGMLLLQAAWIFTLPPFRGTDEIDHAYRAAAVARGEVVVRHGAAEDGRGHLVTVSRSLVEAAGPVCGQLDYNGPDNCRPVRDQGDGLVLVASSATAYAPAYYWVVGTAARPFSGAVANYAMRVTSALICAILVAWAAWASSVGARTAWPVVTLVAALTPVAVFSASIVAPNGVELSAALLLWSALLALGRLPARRHVSPLVVAAGTAAAILVAGRPIGPLWALLVVATAICVLGVDGVRGTLEQTPARVLAAVIAVGGAVAVAGVGWTLTAGRVVLEPDGEGITDPLATTLAQMPLWILQGIAAFPRRAIPALPLVYALVGVALLLLLSFGIRVASWRLRGGMALAAAVSLAVPVALTLATITTTGPIWQGRYGAPYHVGLVLLAGTAFDQAGVSIRPRCRELATGGVALAVAHAVSVIHVLRTEQRTSPLAGDPSWWDAPAWVVVLLISAATVAWSLAVARRDSDAGPVATAVTGAGRLTRMR